MKMRGKNNDYEKGELFNLSEKLNGVLIVIKLCIIFFLK